MNEDIYILLGKHYHGVTSKAEERLIADFKRSYPEEYNALKAFFEGKKAQVKDFDSAKAWKQVLSAYQFESGGRVVPMFPKILRVAAAVALLVVSWLVFEFVQDAESPQILTADGSQLDSVVLWDGSIVWLNDDAILNYPDKFGDAREVQLIGEGFFDVARDEQHPFKIQTSNATVKVLGTSFNVNSDGVQTRVSVATGLVEVKAKSSIDKKLLKAGFSGIVSGNQVSTFETTNPNFNAWKSGVFVFENASIERVIADLNTFYTKEVRLEGESACGIRGNFDNLALSDILQILSLTCNLNIEETTDGYLLKPKS